MSSYTCSHVIADTNVQRQILNERLFDQSALLIRQALTQDPSFYICVCIHVTALPTVHVAKLSLFASV